MRLALLFAAIVLGASACSGRGAATGGFTGAPSGPAVPGGATPAAPTPAAPTPAAPTPAAPTPAAPTSAATPAAASSAAAGEQTVKLSLTEYRISPATVTLKAGIPVTIVASNDGAISHALFLTGSNVNEHTPDFAYQPGQSESISVTLSAGTYTFFCPVDGHRGQGMVGTLIVAP